MTVIGLAVGAGRMAFSVSDRAGAGDRARLYVARLGEGEPEIAGLAGEHPVGWTAAGDLVTRGGTATLRLRAPDGRLRRVLARGVRAFDWDPASRAVVVVERGALRRLNSSQDAVLTRVRALRMRETWLWVQAFERGHIAVVGRRAIAVVRPDGRLWGRSEFPRGGEIAGHGALTTSPDGGAIAFVNLHHRTGIATVQLLREGGRRADRLLMRRFLPMANPTFSAGLAWRGDSRECRRGPLSLGPGCGPRRRRTPPGRRAGASADGYPGGLGRAVSRARAVAAALATTALAGAAGPPPSAGSGGSPDPDPTGVAISGGRVWLASIGSAPTPGGGGIMPVHRLEGLDPVALEPTAGPLALPAAWALAPGPRRLWVAGRGRLEVVDPASARVVARVSGLDAAVGPLAVDDGVGWLIEPRTNRLRRVDPARGGVAPGWTRPSRLPMVALALDGRRLWVLSLGPRLPRPGVSPMPRGRGVLYRLDATTGRVTGRLTVGRGRPPSRRASARSGC